MFDSSLRILVIDDMVMMRKIVAQSCREAGMIDVTEAPDGQRAWEIIQSAVPPIGLVISDWKMPRCTGLELLKRVRSDERFKDLPFILLTAENEGMQVTEALKFGVDNYILKPFTPAVFKRKLEETYRKVLKRKKTTDDI